MSPHPNHQLEIKQASSSPLKGAYLALGLTMIRSIVQLLSRGKHSCFAREPNLDS
jgi:hypothetical protein